MIIYFDMDGCLAKWAAVSYPETLKKGYFLHREPEGELIKLVELLRSSGIEVKILSCAYTNGYAEKEKAAWLKENLINPVPAIFVPYGEEKLRYVPEGRRSDQVLIDDYSVNLRSWESSGRKAVKFYNGINGTKGSWRGSSLNCQMKAEEMFARLTEI